MKKTITVYFAPVKKDIEIDDTLDVYEIEQELNNLVYNKLADEIREQAEIDYFEEDSF